MRLSLISVRLLAAAALLSALANACSAQLIIQKYSSPTSATQQYTVVGVDPTTTGIIDKSSMSLSTSVLLDRAIKRLEETAALTAISRVSFSGALSDFLKQSHQVGTAVLGTFNSEAQLLTSLNAALASSDFFEAATTYLLRTSPYRADPFVKELAQVRSHLTMNTGQHSQPFDRARALAIRIINRAILEYIFAPGRAGTASVHILPAEQPVNPTPIEYPSLDEWEVRQVILTGTNTTGALTLTYSDLPSGIDASVQRREGASQGWGGELLYDASRDRAGLAEYAVNVARATHAVKRESRKNLQISRVRVAVELLNTVNYSEAYLERFVQGSREIRLLLGANGSHVDGQGTIYNYGVTLSRLFPAGAKLSPGGVLVRAAIQGSALDAGTGSTSDLRTSFGIAWRNRVPFYDTAAGKIVPNRWTFEGGYTFSPHNRVYVEDFHTVQVRFRKPETHVVFGLLYGRTESGRNFYAFSTGFTF